MKKIFNSIIKFIITVLCVIRVRGDCILTGGCGEFTTIVETPPIRGKLNDEALEILKNRCPELYYGNNSAVCCTSPQLIKLQSDFKSAEMLFGRCPTCTQNMLKSICALICSPEQHRFLSIVNVTEDGKCAHAVDFRMDPEYMKNTFDSCKGVNNPLTGNKAIDVSCGSEHVCTPQKWYNFLGNYNIFKTNYKQESDSKIRFESPVKKCNESYEGHDACSCSDCQITCASTDKPKEKEEKKDRHTTFIVLSILTFCLFIPGFLFFMSQSRLDQSKFVKGIFPIDIYLRKFFTNWGVVISKHPIKVLMVCLIIIVVLGYGTRFIQVTTDPVKLWAAHDSQARMEKDYFEDKFGPFYRTEQVFLQPTYDGNVHYTNEETGKTRIYGPAFNLTFLREALKLQTELLELGKNEGEGLEKICYAPVMEINQTAKLENCVVQSLFGYIKNDEEELEDDYSFLDKHFGDCIKNPYTPSCLSSWGGPAIPELVLGGYPKGQNETPPEYIMASVLSITIIVKNYKESELNEPAMKWEQRFIEFLSNYENPHFRVAFKAERSIEDGIQEMSNAEFLTVIVSYSLMFLYIVFSLGRIRNCHSFFIESKITLAGGGIVVVMASVFCSLGLFGYAGVSTTMLTIEVIPFLVLAVGVDNIFILVQTYNRLDKEKFQDIGEGLGEALGEVGPSLLLTAATECFCFSIGSLSNMPAVKTFAYFATVAILFDFVLQITAFLALIALDERRFRSQRFDLLCCFTSKVNKNSLKTGKGVTERMFDLFFTPLIMSKPVQTICKITMIIWTVFSIIVTPLVEPGLDQSLSMPKDSYVAKYFDYLEKYLNMGPPVYFVLKPGLDFSDEADQNLVCSGVRCNPDSVIGQINAAALDSERTKIGRISNSWLDDYFDWIKCDDCCRQKSNGEFCPSNNGGRTCKNCFKKSDLKPMRPQPDKFKQYLNFFLSDLPGDSCFKGGKATYADGIVYESSPELKIKDSYFMTYHTPLKTSRDYYTALQEARKISENMNEMFKKHKKDVKVFPYSIFYVFYEQYLTMWKDVAISLGLSLLTVFLVTFTITGFDLISGLIVLYMVGLILINMGGLMWLLGISLNAISLVNLVVCVGIGVEFVSHIVWAYAQSKGTREQRARHILTITGSSVLSGIALTKFSGIVVLAFAKSQIFRVFYFQMYLGMVLIGAIHGLIFLPILLCYFGPDSKQKYAKTETETQSE